MPLEQLTLSDEQVQDIVASLITGGGGSDVAYDDTNDTLTVSLSDSISVNTLEATDSITDPEGNTVTSLSDPIRVTEEASTFAESNITVTENGVIRSNGRLQLPSGVIIDDFESNDLVVENSDWGDWAGDTGKFDAQTGVVIDGTYSAELTSTGGEFVTVSTTRTSQTSTANVLFDVRIGDDSTTSDEFTYRIRDSGNVVTAVNFIDSGNDVDIINNTTGFTWSINTTYKVRINLDFDNDTATLFIDGVEQGSEAFANSVSGFDKIELTNSTFNTADTREVYLDSFYEGRIPSNSGDALVAFDSGSPTDIDSWDLATFQETLDGETVTVDVEDSNGNVLKSDISKDTDISGIATSTDVQLRANLSRNNTTNNPTVDYLARRFTR